MKNLVNKFVQLDGLYKGGVIFVALFILPVLTMILVNVITVGSKML